MATAMNNPFRRVTFEFKDGAVLVCDLMMIESVNKLPVLAHRRPRRVSPGIGPRHARFCDCLHLDRKVKRA